MRRLHVVALLSLALAATACLDPVEPTRFIDGRVAHGIADLGLTGIAIDGTPTFQLRSLEYTYFVVRASTRTYEFALPDDTLSIQVQHESDITAIILLDLDGPTLRAYHLDRGVFDQEIAVINGSSVNGDLEVVVEGPGGPYELTVAPGEAQSFRPPTGAFSVAVRGQNDQTTYAVESFALVAGDYGFLVIIPGGEVDEPYVRLLF